VVTFDVVVSNLGKNVANMSKQDTLGAINIQDSVKLEGTVHPQTNGPEALDLLPGFRALIITK
jgi:hypothetical protein